MRGDPSSANAWPELDIEADVYASKGRDLGRLVLAASPGGGEWRIHRLRLAHPSGTLDPNATGLLIIVLGRGTKLSEKLMGDDKVYEGTMKFGEATDSYDCDGEITETKPVPPWPEPR